MKFLREDLEETASFIEEAYSEGYNYIAYPRDHTMYRGDELFTFFKALDAAEFAAVNGDWYHEPILPFLNNMRKAVDRADLPEVVETGHYYYTIGEQISVVVDELRAIGLYREGIDKEMREILKYGDGPEIRVPVSFGERTLVFNPYINYIGRVELAGYAVEMPLEQQVHKLVYFGADVPIKDVALNFDNPAALEELSEQSFTAAHKIVTNMNRNNLEQLKETLRVHGFSEAVMEKMEENMQKNLKEFTVEDVLRVDKGHVDVTLNFKQSGRSDYYYFNSYKLGLSHAKPLEQGKQYCVSAKGETNELVYFNSPAQAVKHFKTLGGHAELGIVKRGEEGQEPAPGQLVALKEEGKVNFIDKEFESTYRASVLENLFYMRNGAGFTLEQSSNMMQGRAVFREGMLNQENKEYSAWMQLDFDQPRDDYGNLKMRSFSEGYGFDLKKELESYPIKELGDEKKLEALMDELKAGNKGWVTIEGKDGEHKLLALAVPRYTNLNFYEKDGKAVIRESLKAGKEIELAPTRGKSKQKAKGKDEEHELSM